jgi:hypothetical protein
VSKAKDDFPEPESPVMMTSLSRGMSRSTLRKLCVRAPLTDIVFNVVALDDDVENDPT